MRRVPVVAALVGLALTACGEPEPAGGALPPPSNVTTPEVATPDGTTPDGTTPDGTTSVSTGAVPPMTPGVDGPFDPAAEIRPDLIRIEPNPVDAGGLVAVTFPEGTSRGVAYVLEVLADDEWYATHLMSAGAAGYGGTPGWAPIGTEGFGWDDIGIEGPGPDTLVIPEPALAGDYRVCTANSLENICAELTVLQTDDTPGPFDRGTSEPVAELLGRPLTEFERGAAELGFGPVRVAWRNGEFVPVAQDLRPGRVNVAVESRDGVDVVIDARVEADTADGTLGPGDPVVQATIVGVFEGVQFYPACGNEELEHEGVVWYQVQESEYPELYDRAVNGDRESPPDTVSVQGFAPRVMAPGPGDDIGTLIVWSDAVAYFVSDSGDLHAWLVQDELTYNWEC